MLYRATYDITLSQRRNRWVVPDDTRIRETLPTLRWLLKQRSKIVILSWLGRPQPPGESASRMNPVAARLAHLLNRPVLKLDDCVGPAMEEAIAKLKPGQIILLENVRFHPEEEKNDPAFSRQLGRLADLMITDAFGQSHRRVASIVGVTNYLKSYAGPLMEREVEALSRVVEKPRRPLVVIIGGGKVKSESGIGGQRVPSKLRLIKKYLSEADYVLLGGVIANMLLASAGIQTGRSTYDPALLNFLKSFSPTNHRLKLPIDVMVAQDIKGRGFDRRAVGRVRPNEFIFDIGPDTTELYACIIQKARTVVWSGPLGLTEVTKFARGTKTVASALAQSRAVSIVGGGDTLAALHKAKLLNKMSYVSTAGGAMLEFLEKGTLPGIEPLRIN